MLPCESFPPWSSPIRRFAPDNPKRGQPATAELGRSLIRALGNTGITVVYQDPDLRVAWAHNLPDAWGTDTDDITGLTDAEYLAAADLSRVLALKHQVLQDGQPRRFELRQRIEAGSRWYDVWLDADRSPDGRVLGVVTTLVETTVHKQREQALRTLLREVSHRSKNLLAVIQSIANQTGRYSGSIDVFLNRFRGRLQSLASSQDLVTSSNWRGARLGELVEGQAARYCDDPAYSIRLSGADPQLSPNAALHIGLALHELIVNSMSHGALSKPNGYVDLKATIMDGGDGSAPLALTWLEKAPVTAEAKPTKQFGSVALERVVPASLDGEAQLMIGEGRVEYRLRIPAANFELS
ncbi:PAS domain-containing protein [Chelativorans sp. ZYF759]|uniref:sensor histidine kinase n=1 Tax=Chelativorans sp. ZYF759 TaxID=2692213 RepID=UPI00145F4F21|nr:PAS domain-containing sensor histidine kinase [Chelativorans sp. ZYF759]NMG38161.1 PAS domain-containing protein [Chelativorans sp. ZYF759]